MCKVRIMFSSLLDMMCGSLKEKKPEHLKKHFYPQICGLKDFKQLRVGMFHSD